MKLALLLAACLAATPAFAQSYGSHSGSSLYGNSNTGGSYGNDQVVSGYTRSNGTYVESYHRTEADSNPYNNYSTQGNYNPYTGQAGHRSPGY